MDNTIGMVEAQINKIDVILRLSHLGTRTKRYGLMSVFVPRLEYPEGA